MPRHIERSDKSDISDKRGGAYVAFVSFVASFLLSLGEAPMAIMVYCDACGSPAGTPCLSPGFCQQCLLADQRAREQNRRHALPAYTPDHSTQDATLWLRRWAPEQLEAWLDRHDPRLRAWLLKRAMKIERDEATTK
jgi:hypothetical protein